MAKKKWEMSLREARELRKQGAAILFERVTLLSECYDDAAFREWCDAQGTNATAYLDEELADTAAEFLTLRAVLKSHPSKDEWCKHNIRELIAMAIENSKREKPESDARMSWKTRCAELEKECERLRAEIEALHKTLGFVMSAKEVAAA